MWEIVANLLGGPIVSGLIKARVRSWVRTRFRRWGGR